MRKFNLEITVFISGAVVMILEIAGSRVLAPYVGGSTFVWTSLIGIILASLSLGYYLGGRIGDKQHSPQVLSLLILSAAFLIAIVTWIKDPVLSMIQASSLGIRSSSFLGALIIFTLPSIFLGTISPYAIRLKMRDVKTSGRTVGNLTAISTIGSIVGTFLAGFVLISYFGNTNLFLLLAITMAINSVFPVLGVKKKFKIPLTGILIIFALTYFINLQITARASNLVIELDTNYNHVQIVDVYDKRLDLTKRTLRMNNVSHSAIYLENDDLVFEYTKYYHLAKYFKPDFKKGLIIGGGAYSFPKDFLKQYPDATLDVVEIDPQLTDLAKEYFGLEENPRLTIYHEDGRTFINNSEEKYDVIFLDAFGTSYSIPYQLTTSETIEKLSSMLVEDGVLLTNIISAIEGEKGKFFRAEYHTFKEHFPNILVFPVQLPSSDESPQNIILAALKPNIIPEIPEESSEFYKYFLNLWLKDITNDLPIITDDFAPVDQYIMKIAQ